MCPHRVLTRGMKLVGKRGQPYVLLDPLVQRKGKRCNVWSAAKQNDPMQQFVLKQPDDEDGLGWPEFTKEMEMQELLYKSGYVRRMIDVIPPPSDAEPQTMVLETSEKSLWTARLRRPFSLGEVRSVMRSIAIGLGTIHHNNLVYTDLKMENILVNGFDNETSGSDEHLVTKIADLEMAHADFEKPGMFDSLKVEGTLIDKENAIRATMAQEFDLHSIEYYNSDSDTRQLLPPKDETRTELDHWVVKLIEKNIPEKDVETVHVALNPIPELRPRALDLLEYDYV